MQQKRQFRRISHKEILKALELSKGIISQAAKILKVNRSTLYRRIKKSGKLQRAVEEGRELILELAEEKLIKLLEKENTAAILFVLKTLGKNRGYSEKETPEQLTEIKIKLPPDWEE